MDITSVKPMTYELRIVSPGAGRFVGLTIILQSSQDEAVKKVARQVTDKRLRLAARNKNFNADDVEENGMQFLTAAIIGFEWSEDADGEMGSFNGEQLPFNAKNVRQLLGVEWIAEQVDIALGDAKNFFQN